MQIYKKISIYETACNIIAKYREDTLLKLKYYEKKTGDKTTASYPRVILQFRQITCQDRQRV